MAPNNHWYISPVKNEIMVQLIRARGEMLDVDLYRNLKKTYPDLSRKDLDMELMRLEVKGAIYCQRITKTKRKVSLRYESKVLNPQFNTGFA